MEGRFLLVVAGTLLTLTVAVPVHAYDDATTHPALTAEMASLYDRLYPQDRLSAEEREWMLQGSIEEDIVPRSLNHLYDPVHRTGWTGINMGWVPAIVTRVASVLALLPDEPLANVEWIGADALQAAYGRYGDNRSWPAALRAAARGDDRWAYLSLGSALHLVEDAGVPEHARDDTHVHYIEFLTGDAGSPLESYARRYAPGSLRIAKDFMGTPSRIPSFSSPRGYLEDNARFSSASFLTKDTILDRRFPAPVVVRETDGVAYGRTADGAEVPLARRVATLAAFAGTTSSLRLADEQAFHGILEAQFDVLAERTVLLGVGMIRDFRKAEKAQGTAARAEASIWSLGGEMARLLGAAGEQASRAYEWVRGAFHVTGDEPPTQATPSPQPGGKPVAEIPAQAPPKAGSLSSKTKTTPAKPTTGAATPAASVPKAPAAHVATCPIAGASSIRLNEVAWMGTLASASDEWIELVNNGTAAVRLEGWELMSADGTLYADLDAVTIAPGGYALLERTDDGTVPGVAAAAIYKGGLPNAPAESFSLRLSSPCGSVETLRPGTEWAGGDALSRRTMERAAGGGWQTSALSGGTPGRRNSTGFADQPATSTSTEETEEQEEEENDDDNEQEDRTVDTGRVTISEVRSAGTDAGDEFVELYNAETREVSLAGWSLQYFPASATGNSEAQKRDFLQSARIPAHGYFLVGRTRNAEGKDGYRDAVSADLEHRSFSLSGLGASVALVRGTEKAATTTVPEVVDSVHYPQLPAGVSYERAAESAAGCLDPRPNAPGELRGNGCENAEWHVRAVSEPQNRASLAEPRAAGEGEEEEEQAATSTLRLMQGDGGTWVDLQLRDVSVPEDGIPSWIALMLVKGEGETPDLLTTETQLQPAGIEAVRLRYRSCASGEAESSVLLLPRNASACQSGGPLSGTLLSSHLEDESVSIALVEEGALAPGDRVRLVRYEYAGGRAGIQSFGKASEELLEVVRESGSPPGMPGGISFAESGPGTRISWGGAADPDSVDALLAYELSVTSGAQRAWERVAGTEETRELAVGEHHVAVRAIDPQGNRGPERMRVLTLEASPLPEHAGHGDVIGSGWLEFRVSSAMQLRGVAFWMAPEGGPFCCSRIRVALSRDGEPLAEGVAGRRTVDDEGEAVAEFPAPVTLAPGSYRLEAGNAAEPGNSYRLKGTRNAESGWSAGGAPYLRLIGPG